MNMRFPQIQKRWVSAVILRIVNLGHADRQYFTFLLCYCSFLCSVFFQFNLIFVLAFLLLPWKKSASSTDKTAIADR